MLANDIFNIVFGIIAFSILFWVAIRTRKNISTEESKN